MFETAPDIVSILWTDLGLLLGLVVLAGLLDPLRSLDRGLFGLTTAALLLTYAAWRWHDTLPPLTMSFESLWPHLFFTFEMIAGLFTLTSIVILLRHVDRTGQADAAERQLTASGAWPAVDVFICTYNEPFEILEKSIVAAAAIDYPNVAVWVLDDTSRAWLREVCAETGVRYISRDHGAGAKAGNLNNALAHTATVTNAPVILVLDADFVVQPNILRRTVGLLAEPGVAVVQTPQFYYNPDPIQHNLAIAHSWTDDQRFFFDVFQPAKDAWGCAFCVGTSFVVRRDRLEEIGGFPTEAISEDINLTYRLLARGYETHWLNERLSVGLSAEGLPEYITQRTRWCLGTIQVALLRDGPFGRNDLTLTQRWHYLHGVLNWLCKPFLVLMLVAPTIYWFGGVPAFHADYLSFMRYGLPAVICLWAYNSWISRGRTLPFFAEVTDAIAAFAVTATLLSAAVRPFGRPFKVTDKGGDRSQSTVRWKLALMFACVGGASAASIAWSFVSPYAPDELSQADVFNLLWSAVAMIILFSAFLTCFERPRADPRFIVSEPIVLRCRERTFACTLEKASVSVASLSGVPAEAQLKAGDEVELSLPSVGSIRGKVKTDGDGPISVDLQPSSQERHRLIRYLFTSTVEHVARTARVRSAIRGLLRRAFRPERV
jgi:cellulose synthase (UDP-forming)